MHLEKQNLLDRTKQLERELREARKTLAGLGDEDLEGESLAVLSASLGDTEYLIPAKFVSEVVPTAALVEVPAVTEWDLGMLRMGEELIPVMDLGARQGKARTPLTLEGAFIVCAIEGQSIALCVDCVPKLEQLKPGQVISSSSELSSAPYVVGVVQRGGSNALVLGMLSLVMSSSLARKDQ